MMTPNATNPIRYQNGVCPLRLSDLLFGPMLAVVFRRHPIFPSKLAIEIGEVGKATVVRDLRDSLVGLS